VVSVDLVERVGDRQAAVVDVGGGASRLVDALLDDGYSDLTVLDIASPAIAAARARLGDRADAVTWLVEDVTRWEPRRRFDVWHDRAVLHFLVAEGDRSRYLTTLRRATGGGAHVVLAAFGPEGPETCSGLPVRRYDAAAMATLLGREFEALDATEEVHVTPSGAAQPFVYGLFRRRPP